MGHLGSTGRIILDLVKGLFMLHSLLDLWAEPK